MMKILYLIKKSKMLIIVNIIFSLILLFFLEDIIEGFYYLNESPYGLDDSYINFENHNESFDINGFLKKIENKEKVLFECITLNDELVIYYNGKLPNIEIVEGRIFEEKDFKNRTNTAIINENSIKKCKEYDGKLYYYFMDSEFEVIGTFKEKSNIFYNSITAILNFKADILKNKKMVITNCYLDLDENNEKKFVDEICSKFDLREVKEYKKISIKEKFKMIIWYYDLPIQSFIILIAVISLNLFNIIFNWKNNRKNEFIVKRYLGCTINNVKKEMIGEYYTLSLLNFLFSLSIYIILKLFINGIENLSKIIFINVLFAYLLYFFVGLITILILLFIFDDWIEDNL